MQPTPLDVFKVESKKSLSLMKQVYSFAVKQNLVNTQEFINWQDIMNTYSLLPPENVTYEEI